MAYTPPGAGTFTTIHFVLIALLALATLLVIAAGVRRARVRREADNRVEREAAEAGVPEAPSAPAPTASRDAPLAPQALDRSAARFVAPPPADDDFVRPRPVATDAGDTEPRRDEAPPPRTTLADEPLAAAAPMDASPSTIADPAPAATGAPLPEEAGHAASLPADGPVTQLKGLGPKVAARLAELGITTVGQIAALDADQAQDLDARLGPFSGRMHRDRWIEQARFLAAGDVRGFEAVFGKL